MPRPIETVIRNGVRRPLGTISARARVWMAIETLIPDSEAPLVSFEAISEAVEGEDVDESQIRSEYSRWKRFHGRGQWKDTRR